MSKPKKIKPSDRFVGVADADVLARGTNVQTSMTGNANFAVANAGAATAWTTMPLSNVKAPIALKGLTPATTYLFQARALVKDTFTDWSGSISFICT